MLGLKTESETSINVFVLELYYWTCFGATTVAPSSENRSNIFYMYVTEHV